jgi:HrpA-like RNA helicase
MAIRELMTGITYDLFVLDEAHERSINTDVLMAILHKRLQLVASKRERPFKLIIMSATIESSKFMRYFNTDAVINIEGRSYNTDVFNLVEPVESYLEASFNTIMQIHYQEAEGDVLVFLTGEDEIVTLHKRFKKTASEYSLKLEIFMLYSALPHEFQHKIFEGKADSGARRIILATNIA